MQTYDFMVYGIIFPEDEFTADEMLLTVQENWDKISKSYYYRNHQKPQTPEEAERFIYYFYDNGWFSGLAGFIDFLLGHDNILTYIDYYSSNIVVGLSSQQCFPWETSYGDWNKITQDEVCEILTDFCGKCHVDMPAVNTIDVTTAS